MIGQQIRDLEDELGTPLLKRSRRHVELTPAGQVFLDEARLVLAQAQRAVRLLHAQLDPRLEVNLADGTHVVEVKKAGFKGYRRELRVTAGSELSLNAELAPE